MVSFSTAAPVQAVKCLRGNRRVGAGREFKTCQKSLSRQKRSREKEQK